MSLDILLGITGGISAYKIPDLCRVLQKEHYSIQTILSQNALKFVTPTTVETVTGKAPFLSNESIENSIRHLDLSQMPLFVIAPATANCIAKCAHGIADDLLTTTFLSFKGKKLMIPAMHSEMYLNPITQENILKLKSHNVSFLGPETGALACGDTGIGRMVSAPLIVNKIKSLFLPDCSLQGKTLLISAGGTQEPIDAVRTLTNRSTGKLGYMLAELAAFYGADVKLVTTVAPEISNPELKDICLVNTVDDMGKALQDRIGSADALFMAAAVSDFKVLNIPDSKLRRQDHFSLALTGTPDILKSISLSDHKAKLIGFCLEDAEYLDQRANEKMQNKGLDFIIGNTPDSIGQDHRSLVLYKRDGSSYKINNQPLLQAAHSILTQTLSPPIT